MSLHWGFNNWVISLFQNSHWLCAYTVIRYAVLRGSTEPRGDLVFVSILWGRVLQPQM